MRADEFGGSGEALELSLREVLAGARVKGRVRGGRKALTMGSVRG